MRLLRFGRRVINVSALLEAQPSADRTKMYLWLAGPGDGDTASFCATLEGHEVQAFYTWLEDNSDLVTSITPAPAPALVDGDDGHDFKA